MINERLWESVNAEINASFVEEGDLILMKKSIINGEEYYSFVVAGIYDSDELIEIAHFNEIYEFIILRVTAIDRRMNIIDEMKEV